MRTLIASLATTLLFGGIGCATTDDVTDDDAVLDPDLKGDVPRRAKFFGEVHDGGRGAAFDPGPRAYHAFFFAARQDAELDLEVLRSGTSPSFDTKLTIYGPRDAANKFGAAIASDNDSGYGKLSKVSELVVPEDGIYAAVVSAQATQREGYFFELYCRSHEECTPDDYVSLMIIGRVGPLADAVMAKCGTASECSYDALTGNVDGSPTREQRVAAWAEERWQYGHAYQNITLVPGTLSAAQIHAKIGVPLGLTGDAVLAAAGATATTTVHAVSVTRAGVAQMLYFIETPRPDLDDTKFVVVTLPAS